MKLNIISCTQGTLRFAWETFVLLNNLRERNLSSSAHILVWVQYSDVARPLHPLWHKIIDEFKEVKIEVFLDTENFQRACQNFRYLPLFRPHILAKYFQTHPHFSEEAFFYIDTDILITKDIDWSKYLDDDVCYLSDTNSYINATYFDSKKEVKEIDGVLQPRFVSSIKWNEFIKRDILAECASFAGITRKICEDNDKVSGGAQYLLKGIDAQFWTDVLDTTINVKTHLAAVNEEFMQDKTKENPELTKENVGYQSWCADMWGVLWNLWRRGKKTATPQDFDFMWATDKIKDKQYTFLFHNAGVTSESVIRQAKHVEDRYLDAPAFYKGAEEFKERTPFEFVEDLEFVASHELSKLFGTSFYAKELIKIKYIYNLP